MHQLRSAVVLAFVALFACLAPTLSSAQPAEDYYLYDGGVQSGPLSGNDILLGIDEGSITREALVWRPGWQEWRRLGSVESFADALSHAPAPVTQYYLVAGGERIGPLTDAELLDRIAAGQSGADDLAWKQGLDDWTPLSAFEEFEQALAEAEIPPLPDDGPPPLPGAGEPPAIAPMDTGGAPRPLTQTFESNADWEELEALLTARMPSMIPSATAKEQAKALTCVLDLFRTLGPDVWPMFVEANLEITQEQAEGLEQVSPGIMDATAKCLEDASAMKDQLDALAWRVADTEMGIPDGNDALKLDVYACLRNTMEPLSAEHRDLLAKEGLDPSEATIATIEEAYPGISEQVENCEALIEAALEHKGPTTQGPGDPPPVDPAPSETPAVETLTAPPTGVSEAPAPVVKTLNQAVRESLLGQGMPLALVDQIDDCVTGVYGAMDPADQQLIIGASPGMVTEAQGAQLIARYPEMSEQVQRCVPAQ